jgi:NADPH-dependent curcumin reductase CurA
MIAWVRGGRVTTREDFVTGIESAPRAFMGLLEGRNFGKVIVQVSDLDRDFVEQSDV